MLDLRFLNLGQHNVAAFARKTDAAIAAKSSGRWTSSDVFRAYNRFSIFWAVGQVFSDDMILLTKVGNSVTIQFPAQNEGSSAIVS